MEEDIQKKQKYKPEEFIKLQQQDADINTRHIPFKVS
jgi:hypothetical protein